MRPHLSARLRRKICVLPWRSEADFGARTFRSGARRQSERSTTRKDLNLSATPGKAMDSVMFNSKLSLAQGT